MGKDIYVWYSTATDVTGKIIQESLNASGGTTKPKTKKTCVLCWGTKTDKKVIFQKGTKVLNHPNKIMVNRNKVKALHKLKEKGCKVANFTTERARAGKNGFEFPLIVRRNYHQGGSGFWLCLNKGQVTNAFNEGGQYLQKFIDIKDEYRLHVVDNRVIHAVKKVKRENHKDAFIKHYSEHVENFAKKRGKAIDKDTMDLIMDRMARKFATGADMVVRSNTRGWKFSRLKLTTLNTALAEEAVKAVKALGLDYAAVDCCIDHNGDVYIIEVNTGPGLEGTSLEAWVTALKDLVNGKSTVSSKNKAIKKGKNPKAIRERLKGKAQFLNEMVEAANDEELIALEGLWSKMSA